MFESTSRYAALETGTLKAPEGRDIPYKRRRFLPPRGFGPLLAEVTVAHGDRLDLITARVLGDPEQFWRVCDENVPMNPVDLTARVGEIVHVPVPGSWRQS